MNEHEHSHGCREILARLYEYIDGELDETSRAEVREHLELCRPCLTHFEFEELFHEYVKRQVPRPAASDELKRRISGRLRQELTGTGGAPSAGGGIRFNTLSRFALAASLILVVGVGSWWLARRSAAVSCDWTTLAAYHSHAIEVDEEDEDGIETADAELARAFIAERLGSTAEPILPRRLPTGMVTHEACMMPWKEGRIAQFEWKHDGEEISMFIASATCLPITSEPKVEIGDRCYRLANVNGVRALCWKDTCGYVCVMMAERDFHTMLAWAEELRNPPGY